MQAELIAIGSELTGGHTLNSNVAFMARQLAAMGIACTRHVTVADDPLVIRQALREALARAPLVITTGGLGPTFDDITMETIAQTTHRPLVFVPRIARAIRAFCRRHQRRATRLALRQASVPRGADPIANPIGTAPGLWLENASTVLIALPGVPREMQAMMERTVIPRLRRRVRHLTPIRSCTLRTVGIVELDIQRVLRRLTIPSSVTVGLYPHLRAVDIRLTAQGRAASTTLARLERTLRRALGRVVYGRDEQTLEMVVGAALVKRGWTVAVAESCTGGLVADCITNVPGSSRYFRCGIVAYDNRVKQRLLGVSASLLRRDGAVSSQVARAMAQGARRVGEATIGVGITGIAGPTGATATKPVGLVYLALAGPRRVVVKRFHFHGDRLAIKHQTAQMALEGLRHMSAESC